MASDGLRTRLRAVVEFDDRGRAAAGDLFAFFEDRLALLVEMIAEERHQ